MNEVVMTLTQSYEISWIIHCCGDAYVTSLRVNVALNYNYVRRRNFLCLSLSSVYSPTILIHNGHCRSRIRRLLVAPCGACCYLLAEAVNQVVVRLCLVWFSHRGAGGTRGGGTTVCAQSITVVVHFTLRTPYLWQSTILFQGS